MDFIAAIEKGLDRKARINLLPMQMGDMKETFADHRLLEALTSYRPATPLEDRDRRFHSMAQGL